MISCIESRGEMTKEERYRDAVLTVFSEAFDFSALFNILAGLVSVMHEQLIRKGDGLSWPGVCNA